jgi:hypothetical protein
MLIGNFIIENVDILVLLFAKNDNSRFQSRRYVVQF